MMKKLFVLMAVLAVSASVASAQGWGVGGRLGDGVQVVGQKYFANDNYVEVRLGMNYMHAAAICADFSALYNWHLFDWQWTPGNWFLDAGAGLNAGGRTHYVFFGVQGVVKFGYTFENIPLTLAVDVSPSFGPEIAYWKKQTVLGVEVPGGSRTDFNGAGLYRSGISCIYRF